MKLTPSISTPMCYEAVLTKTDDSSAPSLSLDGPAPTGPANTPTSLTRNATRKKLREAALDTVYPKDKLVK